MAHLVIPNFSGPNQLVIVGEIHLLTPTRVMGSGRVPTIRVAGVAGGGVGGGVGGSVGGSVGGNVGGNVGGSIGRSVGIVRWYPPVHAVTPWDRPVRVVRVWIVWIICRHWHAR